MADATYNLNGGFKPTVKRFADLDGPDFFPTPRWATYALADNEKFIGDIWEPACGDGAISKVFEAAGAKVFSSDLFDRMVQRAWISSSHPDLRRTSSLIRHTIALKASLQAG